MDNPSGTIEGTVSKYITLNCTAGAIHDVTANLEPHDYDGDHYYMWDAKQQYWYGYEWTHHNPAWQPTDYTNVSSFYPRNNTDNRYYNDTSTSGRLDATHSCAIAPNANEMSWFVAKGDPHYDRHELWTLMGHLYEGGMWFKKKSILQSEGNYNKEYSASGVGTDLRSTILFFANSAVEELPLISSKDNFFYLPYLGIYVGGRLQDVGSQGFYWSSNSEPGNSDSAYLLQLSGSGIKVNRFPSYHGYRVQSMD